MRAIIPAAEGERCFSMRAVDLAGNEDANDVAVCLGPDDITVGPSYELGPEGYASWIELTGDEDAPRQAGCRAAPGGGSRGSARQGWLAIALALALRSRRAR